jgi:hypothetical protein
MHKNATKYNITQSKWCINKHGTSKIIDTFETYQRALTAKLWVLCHGVVGLEELLMLVMAVAAGLAFKIWSSLQICWGVPVSCLDGRAASQASACRRLGCMLPFDYVDGAVSLLGLC